MSKDRELEAGVEVEVEEKRIEFSDEKRCFNVGQWVF